MKQVCSDLLPACCCYSRFEKLCFVICIFEQKTIEDGWKYHFGKDSDTIQKGASP